MYLKEAKNYFPEIDQEWDLERLFEDFALANNGKQPTPNVQIVLKGLIGGYSPKEIGQSYGGVDGETDPGNRIRGCLKNQIIPVIKSMTNKDDNEQIEWHQISRLLSRYKFSNNSIDLSLENILLHLDYNQQIGKFKTSLDVLNLVGTFLIHGNSQYHGQVWLLNRILLESNHHKTSDLLIPVRLSALPNMQKIMNFLETKFNCQENNSGNYSTEIIINAITQELQTTRLWFSFYLDVRFTDVKGQVLNEFMTNFWQPLITKIQRIDNHSRHSIYLFFIEEQGCLTNWQAFLKITKDDDPILSQPNPDCPYYPIDLGQLEDWTWPVVQTWVNCHEKDLMSIGELEDRNAMIKKFQSIVEDHKRGFLIMGEISNHILSKSWDTISDKTRFIL